MNVHAFMEESKYKKKIPRKEGIRNMLQSLYRIYTAHLLKLRAL